MIYRLSLKKLGFILLFILQSFVFYGAEGCSNDTFEDKLKEQCYYCSGADLFARYDDSYHQLHNEYSLGDIDKAFDLCNILIDKEYDLDFEARYWLYAIRSRILRNKKLHSQSLKAIAKAIQYGERYKIKHVIESYATQGQLYQELKEYDKAAAVLELWKSKSSDDHVDWGANLHNLGLSYLFLKSYDKSLENLEESFLVNQKQLDTLNMAKVVMDLANLYYVQYLDSIAIPYFEKGLEYAKKSKDLKTLRNAYFNMAVVEENRKEYQKALAYRKKAEVLKDSIWNRDKIWNLAEKEKELGMRLAEEKVKIEKIKRNRAWVIASFSLAGVFLFLILSTQLRKKNHKITIQTKELDTLNKLKDELFAILSHDLKTPVHFLGQKLWSLYDKKRNNEQYSGLEIQECYGLAINTSLLIENTLQWALNNKNKLIFNITALHLGTIIKQVLYYFQPLVDLKKLTFIINISEQHVILGDNNTLKIVLRNVFDNAVKYTSEGDEIKVSSQENNKNIDLRIINPVSQKANMSEFGSIYNETGLGHRLCNEFTLKNEGSFAVSRSSSHFGVSISLKKH